MKAGEVYNQTLALEDESGNESKLRAILAEWGMAEDTIRRVLQERRAREVSRPDERAESRAA